MDKQNIATCTKQYYGCNSTYIQENLPALRKRIHRLLSAHRIPYSGRYINLGAGRYLLCNNTRYKKATFNPYDGFPFPVKLRIESINTADAPDTNTIRDLINQVYQFSRIYWKSVKQQNLPVTIKYPEMVAEIAPHFNGAGIPPQFESRLWFL